MTDAAAPASRPLRYEYGPDESQHGDLYLPPGERRPGTVVLIHGGFWRARISSAVVEDVALDLASRGWVVWSIEYRRVGNGGGWPETLFDVAAAIDHLAVLADPAANSATGSLPASPSVAAGSLPASTAPAAGSPAAPERAAPTGPAGLDLTRVVAVGHSAGGQLAAWAAGRHTQGSERSGRQGWGEDLDVEVPGRNPRVEITGVISLAGVLDLARAASDQIGNSAAVSFMDGDAERRPARYAATDPLAQVPIKASVVCVHGRGDFNVPFEQSVAYVETAKAAGQDATLIEIEGDHFTVVDVSSAVWAQVVQALVALTTS